MERPQSLVILTSPPASGKTFWISSFKDHFSLEKVLVISPLRALANECKENWGDSVAVMTPEEWSSKKCHHRVVIFDEFHLFFYWGDSFRWRMWEVFFEISQTAELVVALTATLPVSMQTEIRNFTSTFDEIHWLDHGNQKLKFMPWSYVKAYSRKWVEEVIEHEKKNEDVKLIFCQYREEVSRLSSHLSQLGFSVISCVGGGAGEMRKKLESNLTPDFIICTTVLSHGVNLPTISKIFFLYPVQNIDFWIQMVARGGRRGERFQVYALENPWGIKWNPFTNLLAILRISFKMKLKQNLRPVWFLKG